MAISIISSSSVIVLVVTILCSEVLCNSYPKCDPDYPDYGLPIYKRDVELLQFAENLEHLEADFFLFGAYGYGLDIFAPELVGGGPPPIGAQRANLDNQTRGIIGEFGLQEVGHLRSLKSTVGGFPRPLLDLSASNFARIMDSAVGYKLDPPFNPYVNSINFMPASYVVPYVGLNGYRGSNRFIRGYVSKDLLAGLYGVEAGQDAVIRHYLYERGEQVVHPYNITVTDFTNRISKLRNNLGMCGIKDEGVFVAPRLGAEMRTSSNVLSADRNSLSYGRTPKEILRIVYGTGNESAPGGFFPRGANGRIARNYLKHNE